MANELIPIQSDLLGSLAGELSPRSQRTYQGDAQTFAKWLQERGVTPETISYDTMSEYRSFLVANYAPATGKRMLSVANRLLDVQVRNKVIAFNPAKELRGIKAEDESPHIALSLEQADSLLDAIDISTKKGKRDYAMILCLLYTGIRRFECAALTIGDISMEKGHHILTVQSKGNRRDIVKLRPEVWYAIEEYLKETGRNNLLPHAPLFCQFRRGDLPQEKPIGSMVVYRVVLEYAKKAGIEARLTPHGMRATFVTLSLEGGAKLEQVQVAARHKDPRTTERYWRRRNRLDDNAVDYIRLKER